MNPSTALDGISRLLLDSAPVIYYLEGHPSFGPIVNGLLEACAERGIVYVTTPITLAECLVQPIANSDRELRVRYETALLQGERIEFRPIAEHTAREAARLRAELRLQLADALQVAVAMETGCEAVLTNDAALSRVTGLRILQISEIEV